MASERPAGVYRGLAKPKKEQGVVFTKAASDEASMPRASALRGRRAAFPNVTLAGVPSVARQRGREVQLASPAVQLADGVGAHAPDHLRCERVTKNFANFDRIGSGSSSVVYRARRLHDNRRVVIKAMRRSDAGETSLAKREFDLLSGLKHPNIIVALDVVESPSCVALMLEDIAGRSLRSVVRSACAGRLDEPSTMRLFVQSAAALDYSTADLHGRNIVHRDLKPANCLVSKEGVLKLIDFNVAASTEGGDLLTPTGTREFRAPELLSRPYTPSADVWSLGLCLHFMLHGRTPSRGADDRPTAISVMTASSATASDGDASDGSSYGGASPKCSHQARAMTEQPRDEWGGSVWALRRCCHRDSTGGSGPPPRSSSLAPPAGSPAAEPGARGERAGRARGARAWRCRGARAPGSACRCPARRKLPAAAAVLRGAARPVVPTL
ncbi:unnamed protein product [Prorocentrum cordatum]|uniref:Protein kinase domain-containing protein n=1 Tax=Prorocentrum cordatum TaxID=2364126 RepID=A0ABN9W641_9DINO|nr:unnamed protein product [Polarella glacialis]